MPYLLFALITILGNAGDWPQILGPQRNGVAESESLADSWPDGKPKQLWRRRIGTGFAAPVIVGDAVFLFHRAGDSEIIERIKLSTGESQWMEDAPTTFRPQVGDDNGPRCTPILHGDKVITYGARGRLACYSQAGKSLWERETHREYRAPSGYFGAGSSPVVEGNTIIVNVGAARKNAGVVAFSLTSGEPVWTSSKELASYASPVATTVGETRHLLVITRLNLLSLDPTTGKERFRYQHGMTGPTANGASPLVLGDRVLITSSYGIGATYGEIQPSRLRKIWSNDDTISSQYVTPVPHGDFVYGYHGRVDYGGGNLRCIDPKTGKVQWNAPEVDYGHVLVADDKLLVMTTEGSLRMVAADSARYRKLAEAKLLPGIVRALPALSNGHFLVRNENTLLCVKLGP